MTSRARRAGSSRASAALFEEVDLSRPGEIHPGGRTSRLQTLRDVLSPDAGALAGLARLVRLEVLFTLDDNLFRPVPPDPNRYVYYSIAREALRWLDDHGHLWPFYEAWREGVLEDPTGERAFAKAVGKTPAEATPEWLAWIGSAASEGAR